MTSWDTVESHLPLTAQEELWRWEWWEDSLMEEVRSDLDLEKLGSTRSDRKEVGRVPHAVGWQTQAIATGWVGTMMEEWVLKVVSGNI